MPHNPRDDGPVSRRPKAVHVSLESADPLGPSMRRLANSDAIVMTFPRDSLRRIASYPEISRRGVYMLIAPNPGTHALRIYVGQAQNVLRRLQRHERDREYPRYLQITIIVSTDDQMRGDIAIYIEQRIIQALVQSDMVQLENRSIRFPALHKDDRIIAEQFFRDALLLIGPVEPMAALLASTVASQEMRNDLLEKEPPQSISALRNNILYELRRDECHAFAVLGEGRNMRVLAGAKIARHAHESLPRRGMELRERLLADRTLVPGPLDGWMILLRDIDVSSQAGAADLVTGRKTDGARPWKLANFNLEGDDDV